MSDHPRLCICIACMQRRLTLAEEEAARWKKGVEDANKIAQRFEAENVKLRDEYRRGVEDAANYANANWPAGVPRARWDLMVNGIRALAPPATESATGLVCRCGHRKEDHRYQEGDCFHDDCACPLFAPSASGGDEARCERCGGSGMVFGFNAARQRTTDVSECPACDGTGSQRMTAALRTGEGR